MMCASPMSVPRPGGNGARDRVTVPCGVCGSCLSNRRNEWSFRIQQEWKYAKSAWFITFTYSDRELPLVDPDTGEFKRMKEVDINEDTTRLFPSLWGQDIKLLNKKIRHEQEKIKEKRSLVKAIPKSFKNWRYRYYLVGEYSPVKLRPHYHGLMFNLYPEVLEKIPGKWGKGFIHVGQLNGASIHYTTKYFITNKSESVKDLLKSQGREKEFTYMSKRPGIGYDYLKYQGLNDKREKSFRVLNASGMWQKMPRFYRESLFNDKELEERNLEIEGYVEQWYDKEAKRHFKGQENRYIKGEMIKEKAIKKGTL